MIITVINEDTVTLPQITRIKEDRTRIMFWYRAESIRKLVQILSGKLFLNNALKVKGTMGVNSMEEI